MLVLCRLPFLPVVVSTVYVQEQVLGLVSDERRLLVQTSVYLDLEVELFVQSTSQVATSRVQDQTREVVDNRRLLLEAFLVVVLHSGAVEHLLDCPLPRVEDGVVGSLGLSVDDGRSCIGIVQIKQFFLLLRLIVIFGMFQAFTQSFDDQNVDLREVFLLPVRDFVSD